MSRLADTGLVVLLIGISTVCVGCDPYDYVLVVTPSVSLPEQCIREGIDSVGVESFRSEFRPWWGALVGASGTVSYSVRGKADLTLRVERSGTALRFLEGRGNGPETDLGSGSRMLRAAIEVSCRVPLTASEELCYGSTCR